MSITRCGWVTEDPLYIEYHDSEWGVPVQDDLRLFELLLLEGAQAGLSWYTILKRRENYRRAFEQFDPQRIACYGATDVARLLTDSGIVRNRLKVSSAIANAAAFLGVQEAFGSFASYLWGFVDGRPLVHHFTAQADVPATTPLSAAVSRDLRRRGFRFVGPTIVYSYLQAVGVVMDHVQGCYRYAQLASLDERGEQLSR